jgi:hypothetical protein
MYEVGMEVEAWCGQCKVSRRCRIDSLAPDGSIDRVNCTYCQTSRNYRPPQTISSPPLRALRGDAAPTSNREFTVPEDEIRSLVRSVVREELEIALAPIG